MTPKEEMSEETKAQINATIRDRWLSIFHQLSQCERFVTFVESNYQIDDIIDDEAHTIETRVIEKPLSIGPPLSKVQVAKIHLALCNAGVKDPVTLGGEILKLLGEEDSPLVSLSDTDIKKVNDRAKLEL